MIASVFSLYGEQNKNEQQAAIAPSKNGKRKVVLTTNVAETSLTIEGIRIVVDSGKRRAANFNLKPVLQSLLRKVFLVLLPFSALVVLGELSRGLCID